MKKFILAGSILILIIAAVTVAKLHKKNEPTDGHYQASLRTSWIPSASFAGDVVAATKYAPAHNLNLKVEFGGPDINPIQMVISRQNTFGYISADEVLSANDKGADLVILGVQSYNSPAGFVSLANKNISTPKDFEGKKVGVLPFGDATLVYESMLKENGIDRSKVKEITISHDLKPFISGAYDVHPVFVYDETVTLDQQGIKYNVLEPKNFGVKIKGPVYFTKRSTLEQNPEMVKAFIESEAEGWSYAINNPDQAIEALKAYAPELDANREKLVMRKGIPYFTAYKGQPLNSDTDSWNEMAEDMKSSGLLDDTPDLNRVLQLQYIQDYYNNSK